MARKRRTTKPSTAINPPTANREWAWGLILALAVIVVYQPVWYAGYIWDDEAVVFGNPVIAGPLGLKEIWTTSAADICPLTLSTFWLEYQTWGANPLPYHLVNVLLQAACALVLWRVLLALRIPGAWLGAALWALHPVQVESVAWITEMKNTESGLFYLLAILFYLKGPLGGGTTGRFHWKVLVFAALALTSKSSTVILPLVLCLVAWWMDGRWQWRRLSAIGPIFFLAIITAFVTAWLKNPHLAAGAAGQWQRTFPERLVSMGDAVWFYLGKLLWPYPLLAVYPRWKIEAELWYSYLPLLAVMAALFGLWRHRQTWGRPYFFAFGYFVVALGPVLGLVDNNVFRYSFVFDHFQYLAAMGPLALAGAGLDRLMKSVAWGEARPLIPIGVLALLGILSWERAWAFENPTALWTDTLQKDPASAVAYTSLGLEYGREGKMEQAIASCRKAVEINPDVEDHYNLGWTLSQAGRNEDAIAEYRKALDIDPGYAKALDNLGIALMRIGKRDEAISEFRKALETPPDLAEPHNNLANALMDEGHFAEAVTQCRAAVELNPKSAEMHNTLGYALVQTGKVDEGTAEYRRALELDPQLANAHNNLGIVYAQSGRLAEAIAEFETVLLIKPDDVNARNNLERAKAQLPSGGTR